MSDTGPTPGLRNLGRYDQLFLGGSLLALVCTFLPFDGINIHVAHAHNTEDAWHLLGVLPSLLVLLVLVIGLARVVAHDLLPEPPVSFNLIEAGGMATAVLFFFIRWFTLGSTLGYKIHLWWGGYLTLIVTIATTAVGVLRMREVGESMPWETNAATPPAA